MAHQFFFNSYILDNLPTPEKGFDVVQDLSEPRLHMYVTAHGVKSFFVRKRIHGKDKRIILGTYPNMDIEKARSAVNTVLAEALKDMPSHRKKISFIDFVEIYLTHKVHREENSLLKLKRGINLHFKDLLKCNIQDITEEQLNKVLDGISGRAMAARMQELLYSMFKYAKEQGYVKQNTMQQIEQIKVIRRKRPLTKEGLQKLYNVIQEEPNLTLRSAFLMLIYGFAPKTKIFKMRWDDIDFNHDLWGEDPLSGKAILLLQNLPQDGEWVFMLRGHLHLIDPRASWHNITIKAGIPDLTMDDVYKFVKRLLVWNSDKDILRQNMNDLLFELLDYTQQPNIY
ncbi:MAG: integrase family protein [Alphaproteobacteria bacterium]|nr:integrase family protein [Alphaproteobacteria bacterium]